MVRGTKDGLVITDHPAYEGLKLKREIADDTEPFTCSGCIKAGAGDRYRAEGNGDLLHICCAVVPVVESARKHLKLTDLKFLKELPNDGKRKLCRACDKGVNRFVYFHSDSERYFHPCCANGSCKCTPALKNSRRAPMSKMRNH